MPNRHQRGDAQSSPRLISMTDAPNGCDSHVIVVIIISFYNYYIKSMIILIAVHVTINRPMDSITELWLNEEWQWSGMVHPQCCVAARTAEVVMDRRTGDEVECDVCDASIFISVWSGVVSLWSGMLCGIEREWEVKCGVDEIKTWQDWTTRNPATGKNSPGLGQTWERRQGKCCVKAACGVSWGSYLGHGKGRSLQT